MYASATVPSFRFPRPAAVIVSTDRFQYSASDRGTSSRIIAADARSRCMWRSNRNGSPL
jgi:hypothetical protein